MKSNSNLFILLLVSSAIFSYNTDVFAQSITLEDLVTYNKESNFIKEFQIPMQDIGLKGIAAAN